MRFPASLSRNLVLLAVPLLVASCTNAEHPEERTEEKAQTAPVEEPEWFNLRPEAEKAYGYTHAVRIGNAITISGAVSMDDTGAPTAVGDLAQQMRNCYSDLDKVLKHYGCTFDDVVAENVFTTNMAEFIKESGYRNTIYTKQFPAGSWIEVEGLALPEFMIEIELEVHSASLIRNARHTIHS
ncbi:MAG: RidA family protein [Flavobacteriales bacterium]|nr:RidA family protein [Flavobacteriales bacterium]